MLNGVKAGALFTFVWNHEVLFWVKLERKSFNAFATHILAREVNISSVAEVVN
jgi:hypothetical protein